jgi:hypothetical protein
LKRFRHSSVPKNSLLLFTVPQWASFSKKLQKLITLDIVHIYLFPIQGKGKIAREIRIWTEKFEKSSFSGSNRPFNGFDHYDQPH